MNDSMDSLAPFVPAVLQLCGGDPDRIRKLMDLVMAAATAAAANTKTTDMIDGQVVWAELQKINKSKTTGTDTAKGPGQWKQLAKYIKDFLASAGQTGAPGCRTTPDQKNRKKATGYCPVDMFTREEMDLILEMARRHGRSPAAIQKRWVWEASAR